MIRRLLDLSVYIGSALEFMIMLLVYGSQSHIRFDYSPLGIANLAVAVNMSFTLLFVGIYMWIKRRAVFNHVRNRAKSGRDMFRWLLTFGGGS